MGGKESKEKKFYTKSQTINLGKKKLGEVFDIDITTNSSIGTGYRIINENEYKEYLEYVGSSSKYEGKDGECGADSSNSISFKGIKTGSTTSCHPRCWPRTAPQPMPTPRRSWCWGLTAHGPCCSTTRSFRPSSSILTKTARQANGAARNYSNS